MYFEYLELTASAKAEMETRGEHRGRVGEFVGRNSDDKVRGRLGPLTFLSKPLCYCSGLGCWKCRRSPAVSDLVLSALPVTDSPFALRSKGRRRLRVTGESPKASSILPPGSSRSVQARTCIRIRRELLGILRCLRPLPPWATAPQTYPRTAGPACRRD